MNRFTKLRRLVAIASAACLPLAGAVAPAHALTVDQTCLAAIQANMVTPLFAGQTTGVDVTASFVGCTGPLSADYASATVTATGTATAADLPINPCSLILTIAPVSGTITWSPVPDKSDVSASFSTNPVSPYFLLDIDVTRGPFAGDEAIVAFVITPNADCALNGLKTLTAFPVVVAFTH